MSKKIATKDSGKKTITSEKRSSKSSNNSKPLKKSGSKSSKKRSTNSSKKRSNKTTKKDSSSTSEVELLSEYEALSYESDEEVEKSSKKSSKKTSKKSSKKSDKKSEIPEPNFITLIGGISIMKYDSLNSFHINLETDGDDIPIYFKRMGTKWKVVEIGFPEDIFNEMK